MSDDLAGQESRDEYLDFLRVAERAVSERFGSLGGFLSGATVSGSWHPNGFAVFEVEFVEGLGLIRLHVWPQHLRPALDGHPEIHQHSFHLYSRIICGTYLENQFEISEVNRERENSADDHLRTYQVAPTGRGGPDIVQEGDRPMVARPLFDSDLIFSSGSWHDLPAGVFHSTPIPVDTFCATLAVLSPHLPGVADILVGKPGFRGARRVRPMVAREELRELTAQFNAAMAAR
ncbi:hypothetical protein [Micromonospora sp. NBC_00617]|uniref:hypothetical protein n=1 Tax=Micromonospora sp. NBC_00617 TaxID=2903587 RepID=UPI0030E41874